MNMMPGVAGVPKELLDLQEGKMERFDYILQSMTFEELRNPKKIKGTRLQRIAFGAGVSEEEVRELVKSFNQLSKLSKKMNPRKIKDLEKNFNLKKLKGMM